MNVEFSALGVSQPVSQSHSNAAIFLCVTVARGRTNFKNHYISFQFKLGHNLLGLIHKLIGQDSVINNITWNKDNKITAQ